MKEEYTLEQFVDILFFYFKNDNALGRTMFFRYKRKLLSYTGREILGEIKSNSKVGQSLYDCFYDDCIRYIESINKID